MPTTLSPGLAAGAEPGIDRLAGIETAAANGDPLIFVYGPGTDDAFVDAAYRVCEIEECLWEVLHGAGFQRIAFFSLDKKFYFRDEESRGALRPGGAAARAPRGTGPAAAPGGRRAGCATGSPARSVIGSSSSVPRTPSRAARLSPRQAARLSPRRAPLPRYPGDG